MEFRRLGNSGLKVSSICLGTMAFGRWIDEEASAQVLETALEAGINFIDTADMYGPGQDSGDWREKGRSEEILGRHLKGRRHQVVLATKVFNAMGPGPNDRGLSRGHIMRAVEASLRRLQTDHIDLYQLHRFDPETPVEETMRALDDLVRQGKVRYIGCSSWAAWQIAKAHAFCDRQGLTKFISVQPQYSLLVREIERELVPFCLSEGVGIMPYSPIARGLLTGKYRRGEPMPAGTRGAAGEANFHKLLTERNWECVERFRSLCESWDVPMVRVATAWVMANPAVTSVIIGASKPYHITDAAAAAQFRLTPEQHAALEEIFG